MQPVAWRYRDKTKGPGWLLTSSPGFFEPEKYEIQPLYAHPEAAPTSQPLQVTEEMVKAGQAVSQHTSASFMRKVLGAALAAHPEAAVPEGPWEAIQAAKIHMGALEDLLTAYRFQRTSRGMDAKIDAVTNSRDEWRDALNRLEGDKT